MRGNLISAIASISLVGVGLSTILPLLAIELERRGVSGTITGLQIAVQAVASILTAFAVPRLTQLLGGRMLIVLGIALCASAILGYAIIKSIWVWFALRCLLGAGLTILFSVSENWITQVTLPARRGLVMGIYATMLSIGFATGPAILSFVGTQGYAPYAAAGLIFLLGLVPALAGAGNAPVPAHEAASTPPLPLLTVIRRAPIPALAALAFGAIETAGFAFLSIWALRSGLEEKTATLLLTVTGLGNVLFQIPLGLLADRVSKQGLLLLCALAGAIGAAALPALVQWPLMLNIVLLLWGGLTAGLYTVGLAHLGERFDESELPSANAAFVMMYSIGMFAGPPITGLGVEIANPHGYAYTLALFSAGYVVLLLINFARRS